MDPSQRRDHMTTARTDDGSAAPPAERSPHAAAEPRLRVIAPAPLELVRVLCDELETDQIRYCHFKSNVELDRSAGGLNDLDLLVARSDAQRFVELLYRLGFKAARRAGALHVPGVDHYYGFDPGSGRFVHIHAHLQLSVGDDMTKNYRLPFEEPYLSSTTRAGMFRIPAPEFELVLFVVRMVLKHCAADAALGARRSLSRRERDEFGHLLRSADVAESRAVVQEHLAMIGTGLFDRCLEALRPSSSFAFRAATAYRLQRELAPDGRHGQATDGFLKVWRRQWRRARRRLLRRTGATFDRGSIVAVVGGDGSGKTSTVGELERWLSTPFETTRVHLGKPPRSGIASLHRASVRIGKMLGLVSGTPLRAGVGADDVDGFPGYTWLLFRVLKARDRYGTYLRARRFAARGGIVLCDRYPLPQIRSMDRARTAWGADSSKHGALVRYLVDRERRHYDRIADPDLLIVLRLDPEVAVRRKREDDPEAVRLRNSEVRELSWQSATTYIADASRSSEDVLSDIKRWLWPRL